MRFRWILTCLAAIRTALSLRAFGVTDVATANVKNFRGFGFDRVWNPVET